MTVTNKNSESEESKSTEGRFGSELNTMLCTLADGSIHCKNCYHSKPHKRTSDRGPMPEYGRCSDDFCFAKQEKCKCV